jgi:Second Messenger Oligonucleotide or Dinucleotide Synthetase domain
MGGGGGGGPFVNRTPQQLIKQVQETEDETSIKAFETELANLLSDKLASANSRDVSKVADRLDDVKHALEGPLEGTIDLLFGGSVAKHTYVDGMSDIDSLLILNDSALEEAKPADAIAEVGKIIKKELGDAVGVTTGRLAVTLTYPDGMQLQLLPAFRTGDGLKVPSFRVNDWSGISPEKFQKALSRRNEECGGKLVPTVKLAKAVIGILPEAQRLTGYHIESLAIAAFRGYDGPKTTAAMLPLFFEKARELVMKPIRDSTGQSVHVDGYLGDAVSSERIAASHILNRISKRMRNASAHQSGDQWQALFGSNED